MTENKTALLLDMNSTFMFGEDRFDQQQDFSLYYHEIGGVLSSADINDIIRKAYDYLDSIYPNKKYRHSFPSVEEAVRLTSRQRLSRTEMQRVTETFAFHERGHIPEDYVRALQQLSQRFTLSVVIDIWAPKKLWLKLFDDTGVSVLFSAASFSSDHGKVKPSPKPFEMVIEQLGIDKKQALVIGDSVRRDLGGAQAAGIDCVLVGGATHPAAVGVYPNLLEFTRDVLQKTGDAVVA